MLDEALDQARPPRNRVSIQVAAQLLVAPTLEHFVDRLGLRMQHGNRTDDVHATAQIDGQNGLQTVSFNESLNHLLNHYHIGAGSRITLTPLCSACRPHSADGHSPAHHYRTQNHSPTQALTITP